MAKEILVIPEEHLAQVIDVIRAGLRKVSVDDEVRENLQRWCDDEQAYLERE